ncbi:MAG: uracil-DNA glycosylase family protein [Gammaproteobacteria bacterium]|nr:uracil-DNA glycosylase family protein [Gammaproteobacteria bacterium]
MTSELQQRLLTHQQRLASCQQCPKMTGPVIIGHPVVTDILQLGQAPGIHEAKTGRPFSWTAGKTLFKWYQQIGVDEHQFRSNVYMAAVCRCFPGKHPKHGDRVPDKTEITTCEQWLDTELELLKPKLIIPVGKLAMTRLMSVDKLKDVVGKTHRLRFRNQFIDVIPLPHPSGASTWHNMEPGKTLLQDALAEINKHPSWKKIMYSDQLQDG